MRAAWYCARVRVRSRPGGFALFALVAGVVAGLVMAGVAGSRRTEAAFDRMVERYDAPDIAIFPTSPEGRDELLDEVGRRLDGLAEVERHGASATALLAAEDPAAPGTWYARLAFSAIDDHAYVDLERPLLLRGRLADPREANEITVDEGFGRSRDLDVGSVVELGLTPPDQLDAGGNGFPIEMAGPPEDYEVVGVVRKPADLAPPLVGAEGTIDEIGVATFYLTPAFWAERGDEVASYGSAVVATIPDEADADIVRASLEDLEVVVESEDGNAGPSATVPGIDRAIDIEARSLLGAALLLGAIGVVLLSQALRRQTVETAGTGVAYRALGMHRRDLAVAGAFEWGLSGIATATIALAVAVAVSPLAPIGIARRADVGFGPAVDLPVLASGAMVVVLLFVLGGGLHGWSTGRSERALRVASPSRVGRWLVAAGAGPSAVIGARMALEPGRGATAVPVRSALTSALLGIGALSAALTFAASLDRVVNDPQLRGWNWDVKVGNYSEAVAAAEAERAILANPGVAAASGWQTDYLLVNGLEVPLLLLGPGAPSVGPQVMRGRLPTAPGEIALASATRRAVGAAIGDTVEGIGPSGSPASLTVVGQSVGNGALDSQVTLDEGAVVTFEGARQMLPPDWDRELFPQGYLVRLVDGAAGVRGLEQLRSDFPGTVFGAGSTNDIENLRRVQWLPRILVIGVAGLALGATAHALLSGVRRRRRDLAVLKCIGFRRRQLATLTTVQAGTFVAVALIFGMPLGVAAGQGLWRAAADQIGTSAGPSVPIGLLMVGAVASVGAGAALSLWPGRAAARTPAAAILRTE